jgi:hypothetical protein
LSILASQSRGEIGPEGYANFVFVVALFGRRLADRAESLLTGCGGPTVISWIGNDGLLPRDDPSSITDMAKSESRRTAFVPDRTIFALPACESPLMHAESRTTPYGLPAPQEKERLSAPGEDRGLSRNATTGALCRRWIHIMTGYGTRGSEGAVRFFPPRRLPRKSRSRAILPLGGLAWPMVRGAARSRFKFTLAMVAYNLMRLPKLLAASP